MNPTIHALDITLAKTSQENQRKVWDTQFEKHHKTFATDIADGFAKEVLTEFQKRLECPYEHKCDIEHKAFSELSLKITKSSVCEKLKTFLVPSHEISPFSEWLKQFSAKENEKIMLIENKSKEIHLQAKDQNQNTTPKKLDETYFNERMAIIGNLVQEKLQETLSEVSAQKENSELRFKSEWRDSREIEISSSSFIKSGKGGKVVVSLWLNSQTMENEKAKSQTIEKYRVKQQAIQKTNNIVKAVGCAMLVCVIIALYAYRDLIPIRLDIPK